MSIISNGSTGQLIFNSSTNSIGWQGVNNMAYETKKRDLTLKLDEAENGWELRVTETIFDKVYNRDVQTAKDYVFNSESDLNKFIASLIKGK
jgi:hypothetical protein